MEKSKITPPQRSLDTENSLLENTAKELDDCATIRLKRSEQLVADDLKTKGVIVEFTHFGSHFVKCINTKTTLRFIGYDGDMEHVSTTIACPSEEGTGSFSLMIYGKYVYIYDYADFFERQKKSFEDSNRKLKELRKRESKIDPFVKLERNIKSMKDEISTTWSMFLNDKRYNHIVIKLNSVAGRFHFDDNRMKVVRFDKFCEKDENEIPLVFGTQFGIYPNLRKLTEFFNGKKQILVMSKSLLSGHEAHLKLYEIPENCKEFDHNKFKLIEAWTQ